MKVKIQGRFGVNPGDIIRRARGLRRWVVVSVDYHNGGTTQLVHLVRLGATGPLTRVICLADDEYEAFQTNGKE